MGGDSTFDVGVDLFVVCVVLERLFKVFFVKWGWCFFFCSYVLRIRKGREEVLKWGLICGFGNI